MQKILVVDDEEIDLEFIRTMLHKIGYDNIETVKGSRSVVEKIKRSSIDLVLLDWHMPGLLGIDILRELREIDTKLPVIMVTSERRKEKVVEAVRSGASDYLMKPFCEGDLKEKVGKLIGQPKK